MIDGCLSEENSAGRRIKDGKPGVYMMKDEAKEKALYYARRVCLNDDGTWVRFLWQVITDRNDSVKSGNDQWIGRERSVHLMALWVQFVPTSELVWGEEVQWAWDPALEFKPSFEPLQTKGTGKGKPTRPPPPLPTQVDVDMGGASSGTTPGPSLGELGVSPGSSMEVDDEEVISSLASVEYRDAILLMPDELDAIRDISTKYVHKPDGWRQAWNETGKKTREVALKVLIWFQTQSVLQGDSHHHKGARLQTSPELSIHLFNEIYADESGSGEIRVKVHKMDCLEMAQELHTVGYSKVAVLCMANLNKPGGHVKRGRDSQEEDLYCRTDISRHTAHFLRGSSYPCSSEEPVVMVQHGVTIIRGTKADGYPFLDDIPPLITLISVAVKKTIEKYTEPKTGVSLYLDFREKDEMQRRIRLMLLAAIKSGCTALVLTPLGCGFEGHPPEEVALMFKREIYRVGKGLPYLQFAVYDDKHKFSNFDVFRKILEKPEGDDPTWKSARAEWAYSVMASCDEDFPPEERLGDAGGSDSPFEPKPIGKDKTELQTPAGDVIMGTASSESASSASKVDTGGAGEPTTYSYAEAGSKIAGPFGPSPVLPATTRSVLTKATSSKELKNLIIFAKQPSAVLMIKHRRPEDMSVFQIEPALCIDLAANQLLANYVTKLNELAKWRGKWDLNTAEQRIERSKKGNVRDGPGKCEAWVYGVDESPPYVPVAHDKGFQAIDMQAGELMDYASDSLDIPMSYWRNDSDAGNAARKSDGFYNTEGFGELRRGVLLRIVHAKYGLPKCSFTTPLELYKEDDVYYFPDGAACGRGDKTTTFMAASILSVNPQSRMQEATRVKGENYILRGALTDAARVAAIAPTATDTFVALAAASSSSTTTAPAVKKKPAANKPNTGAAAKKK